MGQSLESFWSLGTRDQRLRFRELAWAYALWLGVSIFRRNPYILEVRACRGHATIGISSFTVRLPASTNGPDSN